MTSATASVNFQHELIQSKHTLLSALILIVSDDDDLFAIAGAQEEEKIEYFQGGLVIVLTSTFPIGKPVRDKKT